VVDLASDSIKSAAAADRLIADCATEQFCRRTFALNVDPGADLLSALVTEACCGLRDPSGNGCAADTASIIFDVPNLRRNTPRSRGDGWLALVDLADENAPAALLGRSSSWRVRVRKIHCRRVLKVRHEKLGF